MKVICNRHDDKCPPCMHDKPHEPNTWAEPIEYPHLKRPVRRNCDEGKCRVHFPITGKCVEVKP